jgi:hypothetical protein
MREMDVDMIVLHTSGRGSTERNGLEIAEQLRAIPADDRLNVVVAYSKGAPDVLAALDNDPSIVPRLYAVVSVAGALGGSPLADRLPGALLPRLVGSLSIHKCRNREDGGLDSLRTAARTAWSADHKLASGPKYYAIVTFPQQSRISRALRAGHSSLSKISTANDGQLVHYAELAPGMTLLAYANADHWAIALPLKRAGVLPRWAEKYAFDKNDFPRDVLIEGLVRYLDAVAAKVTVSGAAAADQD